MAARLPTNRMEDTLSRTRCQGCSRPLSFDEWKQNGGQCDSCARAPRMSGPAATYVPGPRPATVTRPQIADDAAAYERLLDELPDELVDELVAMLEAEAARRPGITLPGNSVVREVIEDIGVGHSPREGQWAAWGFAAGFAANVALAKYAQMQTSSPMGQFIGPMLIGGVIAGLACSAIGWGVAKLKDR